MGESAVLAHSYSFAAPITHTDSHEDHTNHALSQSISFGKFMTENLEWGKWSTFSHKKYVEEAEKYSRPGSVAQKKAFFEAHYKRIAEAKKAATEEQPAVTPAEVLLQALETQPPPLSLLQEEEPTTERRSIQNDDDKDVDDEMEEEKESGLIGEEKEEDEELLKEEKTRRRSMTKNRPVFRLSLEKTIPPPKPPIDTTRMEVASSDKTSERPITQSSGKTEEKPIHRKKFSFLNCFRGNDAKTRDQTQSRKKGKRETKKQKKKQFNCLCFKPKTVRES